MSTKRQISRREFLRLTALAAAGTTLAACAPRAAPSGAGQQASQPEAQAGPTPTVGLPESGATRVFTELEPPPQAPPFEGGPKWTPQDLTGKAMVLWGLKYDPHVERYDILAKTFEKRTGAKVEVQPQEWPIDEKVMTAMAAGTPPDVICWMGVQSPPIIRQKGIQPIDDTIFQPLGLTVDKWWRPGAIGAYFHDGKHYGVPVEDNWDGYNVAGRTDLIKKAGSEAEALWPGSKGEQGFAFNSYEDLWKLAEILQQKDDKGAVKLWGLNSQGWDPHSLFTIMRSLGTFWWDVDNKKFNLNSDAAVEALRILVEEPFKRGIEGVLGMNQINAFVGGQVALARGNATTAGEAWKVGIEGENVIVPPAAEGKPNLLVGEGGWGFEQPSRVKNQDVATEFLKFMSTYEAQYIFSQIYGGSPPATWGLMGADIYQGDHPVKVGLRRLVKALDNCVFFGWGYGTFNGVSKAVGEPLAQMREGKLDAQAAAKMMQEGLEAQLKQWESEA